MVFIFTCLVFKSKSHCGKGIGNIMRGDMAGTLTTTSQLHCSGMK